MANNKSLDLKDIINVATALSQQEQSNNKNQSIKMVSALSSLVKAPEKEELFDEIYADRSYYKYSGGGVTFSGGECMLQVDFLEEILPEQVRREYGILPADRAYFAIHEPASMAEAELAKKRLIFEEFFVFSAGLSLMRAARADKKCPPYENLNLTPFYAALPFRLTGAQQRCIDEILSDFRRGTPMNRLVQGDVGACQAAVAAGVKAVEAMETTVYSSCVIPTPHSDLVKMTRRYAMENLLP